MPGPYLPGMAGCNHTSNPRDLLGQGTPLTCYYGADDGTRTRDPHLGKVMYIAPPTLQSAVWTL
jgi:hypothetical protein